MKPPAAPAQDPDKRRKAPDGAGSVYKEKDKTGKVLRYRWEVMVGYLPGGGKDVRRGSAKTEAQAVRDMRKVAIRRDTHTLPAASATRATVADLLAGYLEAKKADASAKTYRKEEQFVSLHLVPHIGKIKQERLTVADVRSLLAKLAVEGLAPETVRGIRGALARALDQAVLDDVLPRNVARLERKKRTRRAVRGAGDDKFAFTPDEVALVMTRTRPDRFHALWATLLHTGMRFGEAAGLTWRDFDPEAGTLAIMRSLEAVDHGAPVLSDPKTYASARTLRIPASLVALLRAHKTAQNKERLAVGSAYRAHDLIFCSAGGTALKHRNLYESFQRVVRRLTLPHSSPHTCRHTAATNMLQAGVPLTDVSYILGHADTWVTAKVYAHAVPRGGEAAWTPPYGLRGLDLLEAWYARADRAREEPGVEAAGASSG